MTFGVFGFYSSQSSSTTTMPNLKSLLKPGSSNSGTKKKQNQVNPKEEKKSPKLGLFRRPSRSKSSRTSDSCCGGLGLHKSGSQSHMMSCTSTSSLSSSCGSPTSGRTDGMQHPGMPKCNTVANFDTFGVGDATFAPKPSKCKSISTFTVLAPSLRNSLVSLGFSRCPSGANMPARCRSNMSMRSMTMSNKLKSTSSLIEEPEMLCRLCLSDMPVSQMISLEQCSCQYCRYCLEKYVSFQVLDGNLQISCPDAYCDQKGILTNEEIESLLDKDLFEKYKRYLLNHEVDLDPSRVWCPKAGCETICVLSPDGSTTSAIAVICPSCEHNFCSHCKARWHTNQTCETYAKNRTKTNSYEDEPLASYEQNGFIKRCPLCNIPIERNDGCAQMMCRRCKHVFCWHCLASLDNDFMLRHYDKGPCKNLLGHSRASVFLHRTQVVGIFAGLGLLLLVASPLLLLIAPCLLCSNCRSCDLHEDEAMASAMAASTSAQSSSSFSQSAKGSAAPAPANV